LQTYNPKTFVYAWALDLLACPKTGGVLCLEDARLNNGRILSGNLCGPDGSRYPIVNGVPRLLVEYRSAAERATADAFGREWEIFSDNSGYFTSRELYREFIPALSDDAYNGKTVLDAGCGAGRWTRHLASLGGRVVAMDFSKAADVCARQTRDLDNVVVVQGSLLAPPFRRGSIDIAVSIGVIDHLSDPPAGVAALARTLAPNGALAFWVYAHEGNELYLSLVRAMRKVTPHVPSPVLHFVSLALALPVVAWARTVNRWVPLHSDGRPRLPLHTYLRLVERLRLRDVTAVVYDQLTPALAHYFRENQVKAMFHHAGLRQVDLRMRTHNSWCALGVPAVS
jgi:SAM-dependent methyltransferase